MICTIYTPEMLKEAKEAYLRIAMGQNVSVLIDQNGERVEYQRANLAMLADLIRKMEIELNACAGVNASNGALQPLRIYY